MLKIKELMLILVVKVVKGGGGVIIDCFLIFFKIWMKIVV